ncbi:D-glycero-alpha-D-manno-heptose-1,7-bisphosphate 7-phosphatase [Humibacter ginsengiterrae]
MTERHSDDRDGTEGLETVRLGTEHRGAESRAGGIRRSAPGAPSARPFDAVLFDRDGTLVVDVPYNTDPDRVVPMPTAVATVRRLREAGIRVGVITNQSGVGRGLITSEQLRAVNAAIDEAIGPFDAWEVCPHSPDAGCRCRKPQPGLIFAAASEWGIAPSRMLVIGDIGSDLDAASAAGASAVLVPNPATRAEEVDAARFVARDLAGAVELAFGRALRAAGAGSAEEIGIRLAEATAPSARLRTSRRRYDLRAATTVDDQSLDFETVVSATRLRADARSAGARA